MNKHKNVIDLIAEKKQLAGEILNITLKIDEIFKNKGPEVEENLQQLVELLGDKQDCIDKINILDNRMKSLNINKKEHNEFDAIKRDIIEIYRELQLIENKNQLRLNDLMNNLTSRMKSLHRSRQTSATYNKIHKQVYGCFVDKKK